MPQDWLWPLTLRWLCGWCHGQRCSWFSTAWDVTGSCGAAIAWFDCAGDVPSLGQCRLPPRLTILELMCVLRWGRGTSPGHLCFLKPFSPLSSLCQRKRRIPIPIRTSSLESLTAVTWVGVLLLWFMCVVQRYLEAQRGMVTCSAKGKPLVYRLSSSFSSMLAEPGRRGCCRHRADLQHFPFLQENAHGDTLLHENSPRS